MVQGLARFTKEDDGASATIIFRQIMQDRPRTVAPSALYASVQAGN